MNKRNIMLCVLLAFCSFVKADDVIPKNVERRFNLEVFNLLDAYESYATMSSKDHADIFKALFDSDQIEIYNDLMGLSEKPKLTVEEYIQLLRQGEVSSPRVSIEEIRKEAVIDGGVVWLMDVTFDKDISYFYQEKILLDARMFYGSPYHIKMRFSFPKNTDDKRGCKIVALEGKLNDDVASFPTDFMVIEKTVENNGREENLTYNGGPLRFNNMNQVILPREGFEKLSYFDSDVKMKKEQDSLCSHLCRLSFHPRHFRIKPHAEFSLNGYYELKGNTVPYLGFKNKDITYGFDIGYTFPTKKKIRAGLFTGLALSNSEINFSIKNLDYHYNAGPTLDVDGDSYVRYYNVSNMTQNINLKTLVIPLYLDLDFQFLKYLTAYLNVGAKAYINLSNTMSSKLFVKKYGVYPSYNNLRIDENLIVGGKSVNGFGSESLYSDSQQRNFVKETNSLDAFAGAGFRVLLYRQFYLDLGLRYQQTIYNTPISMPNENVSLQPSGAETKFPLIEYLPEGKERIHSITSHFDGIKRKALKLNVGLMIKF